MSFRKVIFWVHLVAGLIAGVVIGIMSITGVALAYEKEIIAWAERDVQRVTVPPGAVRLPVDELLRRVRAAQPDAQPSGILVKADPEAAVAFTLGRAGSIFVDPYTGQVRTAQPTAWRSFMSTMIQWHRYIALSGDNRAWGKAITGACNAAFLVLGITGLYLWWPRSWNVRALKTISLVKLNLRGKARDFNWHNAIGLWSAIPIIIMTATALPISYQWAGALLNKLNGPAAAATPEPVTVPTPPEGARRLDYELLLSSVQQQMPDWKQITLNLGGGPGGPGGGRGGPAPGGRGGAPAPAAAEAGSANGSPRVAAAPAPEGPRGGNGNARSSGPQPVSFTVREASSWPRTANTTLALNPYTGEVLRREGYDDLPLGRQVRAWTRYLHTGEALGPAGQAVAGLGSLGGVILMWTGFALSWRRFFGRKRSPGAGAKDATQEADAQRERAGTAAGSGSSAP